MSAADALKDFVADLLPAWRVQFGAWVDGAPEHTFAVIKPAGGARAELVRRPQFTLSLIGAKNAPTTDVQAAADLMIEAMRADSGALISLQPGEPAFMSTSDGRPVFEIAILAISN